MKYFYGIYSRFIGSKISRPMISKRGTVLITALFLLILFTFAGCGAHKPEVESPARTNIPAKNYEKTEPSPSPSPAIDLFKVMPNENGRIMVVMFHNFVDTFKSGDMEYTTTFRDFRALLKQLYDMDYRLISMNDFLSNNITVAAGCIPMVFTFDDGTAGQFNLIDENGVFKANPASAVGVLEEFNLSHPDFGLKGTFYVNLGLNTFTGKGTMQDRLKYLITKGFEIGNHTFTHINLIKTGSKDKLQEEIGKNQAEVGILIQGYKMNTFSLPYGIPSKKLIEHVIQGNYQGVQYHHSGLLEVGWDPSHSSLNKLFNSYSIHRVRASGLKPVVQDLAWWLKNLSRKEQYVSDGNPDTVTIPKNMEEKLDKSKLGNKKLIIY